MVSEMSEEGKGSTKGVFQKLMRGIIKLSIAGFIIQAVSSVTIPDVNLSNNVTLPGSLITLMLKFAVPLYLIFSALDDFGIRL
jgi:hypothetical protein